MDLGCIAHSSSIAERPAVSRWADGTEGCSHVAGHAGEVTEAVLYTELFIFYSYCCHASNSGMAC